MKMLEALVFTSRTGKVAMTVAWCVFWGAGFCQNRVAMAESPAQQGPVVKFVASRPPVQAEAAKGRATESSTVEKAVPAAAASPAKALVRFVKPPVDFSSKKADSSSPIKEAVASKTAPKQSSLSAVISTDKPIVRLAQPVAKPREDEFEEQIQAVVKNVNFEFVANSAKDVLPKEKQTERAGLSLIRFAPPARPKVEPEVIDDRDGENSLKEIDDHYKPIASLTASIAKSKGEMPPNRAAAQFAKAGHIQHEMGFNRNWQMYEFSWEAPGLCHQPLYFEDYNLERYGYSYGIAQPLFSAAHFFGRIPALPYLATLEKPTECIYTLGYYRPGSCAPYEKFHLPFRLDAAFVEGSVLTGMIFLIP